MKTIYRYTLKRIMVQTLQLPKNSIILTAQMQKNNICIWVIVDENELDTEERQIEICVTGGLFDDENKKYINTLQLPNGFVYHLFEKLK